ncbi:MAG: hypothetical protein ACI4P0_04895, partial [Mailhella sp.]
PFIKAPPFDDVTQSHAARMERRSQFSRTICTVQRMEEPGEKECQISEFQPSSGELPVPLTVGVRYPPSTYALVTQRKA